MADVNERLRSAAKSGDEVNLIALLNDPECDVLATSAKGMTALMEASYYGHEACIHHLLPVSDALAKANDGLTALMWAAFFGHEACVRLLIPTSDALAMDHGGKTALMWTARHGNEACVGLLLPTSDLLATDADGRTASAWARKNGHEILAQFIDAYVLAQSEQAALGVAVKPGAPRGRASHRV